MFLSPRRQSNLQPSDLQWDALTIELPGLRWRREGHDMYRFVSATTHILLNSNLDMSVYLINEYICTKDDLQRGKLKENCFLLKHYRKLRKMFLSPRRESHPQPSDLRWDTYRWVGFLLEMTWVSVLIVVVLPLYSASQSSMEGQQFDFNSVGSWYLHVGHYIYWGGVISHIWNILSLLYNLGLYDSSSNICGIFRSFSAALSWRLCLWLWYRWLKDEIVCNRYSSGYCWIEGLTVLRVFHDLEVVGLVVW